VDGFPSMSASDKEYLDSHGVVTAIQDALAQAIKEKPANPLGRIAQLISPAPVPLENYLATIGNTPMVKLTKLLPENCKAQAVYCKMEMQNPGGSLKDRIAMNMMEKAEKDGKLKPGMTVVEATSGNTGIGLAMVCAAKGYKCLVLMPQAPPMLERYMICRQFGAEVILTAAGKGFKGLFETYYKILESDPNKYWGAKQLDNLDNPETHYQTTGPEVWAQTAGEIDYFVHGIGTGGCISGTSKFLKEKKPAVRIVGIEPSNARCHVGAPAAPHTILGTGAGFATNFVGLEPDPTQKFPPMSIALKEPGPTDVVDEWAHASSEESVEWAQKACHTEGMMVGPSAGMALKVACEIACREEAKGKTIVAVIASHGIRYTAHPLWKAVKEEATAALPVPPDMSKDIPSVQWSSADYKKGD